MFVSHTLKCSLKYWAIYQRWSKLKTSTISQKVRLHFGAPKLHVHLYMYVLYVYVELYHLPQRHSEKTHLRWTNADGIDERDDHHCNHLSRHYVWRQDIASRRSSEATDYRHRTNNRRTSPASTRAGNYRLSPEIKPNVVRMNNYVNRAQIAQNH